MIIWLASYPKSGNTYLRAFLAAYFFQKKGEFDFGLLDNIKQFPSEEFITNKVNDITQASRLWIETQKKINKDKKVRFLKTHNCISNIGGNIFTSNETTLGAIYIVRDPRNVFTSIKNHFSYDDEKVLEMMLDKNRCLITGNSKDKRSISFISSWGQNYLSWRKYNKIRRLFIKYEDLINNKYETFRDIVVFINTLMNNIESVDKNKLHQAIKTTNFDTLKNKEINNKIQNSDSGFKKWRNYHNENKNYFFFLGSENKWEKLLNKDVQNKIEKGFRDEMSLLKYI